MEKRMLSLYFYRSWPTGFYSEKEKVIIYPHVPPEERRYTVIWHCPINGKQTFKVEPGILDLIIALCVANKEAKRSSYESSELSNTIPHVGTVEFLPEFYEKEPTNAKL
jgi:hypothetical protein